MDEKNMSTAIVRALVLYHLAEFQSGNATTIHVSIQDHKFKISDDGRGHAIHRTINGLPYLRLVYSQLEYPFDLDQDTPIQLHTIGMSMINSLCKELVVTVHKKENAYIQYYEAGKLTKEETKENPEPVTGTTLEGEINRDLFFEEVDPRDIEQWLVGIKSSHKQLRLIFNDREL
jgi:DNA gyrase/topoisomerase IV subunit B